MQLRRKIFIVNIAVLATAVLMNAVIENAIWLNYFNLIPFFSFSYYLLTDRTRFKAKQLQIFQALLLLIAVKFLSVGVKDIFHIKSKLELNLILLLILIPWGLVFYRINKTKLVKMEAD